MTIRLLLFAVAGATALAINSTVVSAQSAGTRHIEVPPLPANLTVLANNEPLLDNNEPFLEGHAVGTQNYICLPATSGFKWTFTGPQATLFLSEHGELRQQISTHFLSPNPDEGGTPRATWQQSDDSSRVWGRAIASSTDGNYVAPGAIPWLLLEVVGDSAGPIGSSQFARATFIHRLNTSGGIAPAASGCAQASNVGTTALVPYTTDYVFYRAVAMGARN
ncbi:MAG TPA: DUF3455 domain-containing protein [Vicinamibacterales bacterium]